MALDSRGPKNSAKKGIRSVVLGAPESPEDISVFWRVLGVLVLQSKFPFFFKFQNFPPFVISGVSRVYEFSRISKILEFSEFPEFTKLRNFYNF